MTTPNPAELDRLRHDLTNGLLMMREQLAPVFDTADGMKRDMESRGWSSAAAEQVALPWLLAAMDTAMRGVQR